MKDLKKYSDLEKLEQEILCYDQTRNIAYMIILDVKYVYIYFIKLMKNYFFELINNPNITLFALILTFVDTYFDLSTSIIYYLNDKYWYGSCILLTILISGIFQA